ncbi:MAG: hypothetical protein ACREHG_03350 [Candidatus Saccharimonadales bacterium]
MNTLAKEVILVTGRVRAKHAKCFLNTFSGKQRYFEKLETKTKQIKVRTVKVLARYQIDAQT